MADSLSTTALPVKTILTEILGHSEDTPGVKTLGRANLSTLFAAPLAAFVVPGTVTSDWYGKIGLVDQVSGGLVTLPSTGTPGGSVTLIIANLGIPTFIQEAGGLPVNRSGHTGAAGQYALVSVTCYKNVDGVSAQWVLSGDTA